MSGWAFSQPTKEPAQPGKFEPSWESLKQYRTPDWFRDAKFGIWAHWGPQCQPEEGDWYGRFMYVEGSPQYQAHLAKYGHPSRAGFKEVIKDWKAEAWDPEKLVKLYKKSGARYFFAMGNHHDNLDLWDSRYQEWNSVAVGPQQNILAGWARAARNNGLPFGVSIHAAHAWLWYETAQKADSAGPYAGVPYDGKLTGADGRGLWWEGLDPQNLYVQNHPLSSGSEDIRSLWYQWDWENGAAPPSREFVLNFYNRTMDMINRYQPDLIYFDDTTLPFWPVSEIGLELAAHYYNKNMLLNDGSLEAVLFGKKLSEAQKACLVWDVERGAAPEIQELPWQTCTCIGAWHYDRHIYEDGRYKSAPTVIRMLADIVSKNGNLLLSIPMRGNGTIDEKEVAILEGIGEWLAVNGACIYETRPWRVYGEGPRVENAAAQKGQGFDEGQGEVYTSRDIRFTRKGDVLYAIVMAWPEDGEVIIRSLSAKNDNVRGVEWLGGRVAGYSFREDGLYVQLPKDAQTDMPLVLKIDGKTD
ncbi:MAG: alpha-L-fucosidase [Calditrichaeota bacterium]|nr:alpha-L-fucosidase [Calditrichota bacterium]HQU72181.1 alpha-L-fucosidase [Calditrichia bacterium]